MLVLVGSTASALAAIVVTATRRHHFSCCGRHGVVSCGISASSSKSEPGSSRLSGLGLCPMCPQRSHRTLPERNECVSAMHGPRCCAAVCVMDALDRTTLSTWRMASSPCDGAGESGSERGKRQWVAGLVRPHAHVSFWDHDKGGPVARSHLQCWEGDLVTEGAQRTQLGAALTDCSLPLLFKLPSL
ncbi:hypothetical protein EDB89DRAFT_1908794 [Lactarius sanguifluus]|nr:hypothetical protein EDB89DRAFT_1908794 [Lactarius sanguifluus]